MIKMIKGFLVWCATYDLWSFLSLTILVSGAIIGYFKLYRPRKSIKNFLVSYECERAEGWNFPLRILIIFTNHTGKSLHISSASLKLKGLRPDPIATVDESTGKMPIKFPRDVFKNGIKRTLPMDAEFYLEVDSFVGGYVPIDPKHTNKEAEKALRKGKVGILECYVTLLPRDQKPTIYRLKTKPKKRLTVRNSPK